MTDRAKQLQATANGQVGELIALVSTWDEATLRLPCPGREKLGDGTVAACARHTADNYQRIAAFVQTSDVMSGGHGPADDGAGAGQHQDQYTADTVDLHAVVEQLSASRDILGQIAELTDGQLDAIPPNGRFRFCDGQRTLEQVLAGLLKHQRHQVDALKAANPNRDAQA
jgi:hypothetical protein